MKVSIRCLCGQSAKLDTLDVLPHIDPRAVAARAMSKAGWCYRGAPMGKSTITMLCPQCRPETLPLDADFRPHEVQPGTHADDLALWPTKD